MFTSRDLIEALNPAKFSFRESRDSEKNPNSLPIAIFSDVTGSMGGTAEVIVKKSLGVVAQGIYDRITDFDPHILVGAIGDATCDSAPIQVTQFEAGMEIVPQIEKIFIEGGGGMNGGESYPLAWHFLSHKTKCDSHEKRNRKGYGFTIGDECPISLTSEQLRRFLGVDSGSKSVSIEKALSDVQENWHIFHLIVPTSATEAQGAEKVWKRLLGQNVIVVDDLSKLGEIIVSTIQIVEGADADSVASSWDGSTALTVRNATKHLVSTKKPTVETTEEM